MKTFFSLMLVVFMSLTMLSGCAGGSDSQKSSESDGSGSSIKFWSAANNENIMRDDPVPDNTSETMEMFALKGETESSQIIITPSVDVKSYTVEIGDLKRSGTQSVISSSNIEVFGERYIETKQASNAKPTTADMYVGWYPDALVPFDRVIKKHENKIKAFDNQGVWFNINVPLDAEAGNYSATVSFELDGIKKQIEMKLTVFDVEMPQTLHTTSSFGLWYEYIWRGEDITVSEATSLEESYYWFVANKRVTPTAIPTSKYSSAEEYADYLVEFAKNEMVSGYNLINRSAYVDDKPILDYNYTKTYLKAVIDKNIELREAGDESVDLLKKGYYYCTFIDEPHLNGLMDQVPIVDKQIVDLKNELLPLLAQYPDLQESLKNIRHIVTTTYDASLIGNDTDGGVQTFCPTIDVYSLSGIKDTMKTIRSQSERMGGTDFWWYTCCSPENPFPTYQLDDNLISSRVMRWTQYDYRISGTLYWCVNFFYKYVSETNVFMPRDVWSDPASFGKFNGDGYLIYPGKAYGLTTPISTLRLESIREGNEDYEYLWLFERKIEEINASRNKNYNCDEILSTYYSQLYKGVVPYVDSDRFTTVRTALMRLLDDLYNNTDSACEKIESLSD